VNTYSSLGGVVLAPPDPAWDARAAKQAMRERILAERSHRDARQREADGRRLTAVALEQPEISSARCVAAYVSTVSAPGTLALRQALRASGVQVLLPILLDDEHLDWALDWPPAGDAATGSAGRHGPEGIGRAEVLIIPALAVDTLGNRLGQGAGFYDRTLRLVDPTVRVFALVNESEVLDAAIEPVPAEPHDRPVDAVITPNRCLRLPPRRRR